MTGRWSAMTDIQDISSGVTTSENTANDKFRDTFDAIGRFDDDAAVSISGRKSAVELLKGICSELDVAAGAGGGAVNGNPNLLDDGLAAMGTQQDAAASRPSDTASAVSVAKGILTLAGFV